MGAAVSFPLGQTAVETKVFETRTAIEDGADEIDYVVNLTELKNGDWMYVQREMEEIVRVCREGVQNTEPITRRKNVVIGSSCIIYFLSYFSSQYLHRYT